MHASIGLLLVCGKANCPLLESNQGGCKIFSFLSGRHAYIFIELLWLRVTRKMAGAGASNALAISQKVNKKVFYNHYADKSDTNKFNYNVKLVNLNMSELPEYLQLNKDKYKEWID